MRDEACDQGGCIPPIDHRGNCELPERRVLVSDSSRADGEITNVATEAHRLLRAWLDGGDDGLVEEAAIILGEAVYE